ncbi:MAG: hypothetical protein LUD22_00330 [Coprobacillus sp.]|nr:hypothetical protein [Coprobacillus sp.]
MKVFDENLKKKVKSKNTRNIVFIVVVSVIIFALIILFTIRYFSDENLRIFYIVFSVFLAAMYILFIVVIINNSIIPNCHYKKFLDSYDESKTIKTALIYQYVKDETKKVDRIPCDILVFVTFDGKTRYELLSEKSTLVVFKEGEKYNLTLYKDFVSEYEQIEK